MTMTAVSRPVQDGIVALLRVPGRRVPGWFPLVAERADAIVGPPRGPKLVDILGSRMELDTREYMQRRFFYHCYEAAEVAFVRRWLRAGDRMIDIGAHVGIFTLLAARAVGPTGVVDAFEPVPDTFERLVANIERNGYGWVRANQAAVVDRPGAVRLGIPDERLVGYSTSDFTVGGELEAIDAPGIVLDDYLGADEIRLLKIDAEGFEGRVLAGAQRVLSQSPPDAILLEINHITLTRHGSSMTELVSMLQASGYVLHTLGRGARLERACSVGDLEQAAARHDARPEPRSKLRLGWATRNTMFNAVAVRRELVRA